LASESDPLSDLDLLVPQILFENWSWSHRLHAATRTTLTVFHHLLTPWRRVLLEKLTGLQLVKKFYSFTTSSYLFYGVPEYGRRIEAFYRIKLPCMGTR